MSTAFNLHPRLQQDCHWLLSTATSELLLHRDAAVPWFILAPRVEEQELHALARSIRHAVTDEADALAGFVLAWFRCQRINQASIGNLVPQLHLHVIGRHGDDPCWPGVVWGRLQSGERYGDDRLAAIVTALRAHFQEPPGGGDHA